VRAHLREFDSQASRTATESFGLHRGVQSSLSGPQDGKIVTFEGRQGTKSGKRRASI